MIDEQYKFPCEDLSHATYKWGIEYSNGADGDEVVHVEWFTTEEERNQVLKGEKRRNTMKRFVIFGDIEFFDGDSALIHRVHTAEYIADGDIEAKAAELNNCDFLSPHDYKGRILFMQYPKEIEE